MHFIPRFNQSKFPYFADTTESGDRGVKAKEIGDETEGEF
jgi:hypothetical protein